MTRRMIPYPARRVMAIVQAIAHTSPSLSIEMPLRVHRQSNAKPVRSPYIAPIADIEATIKPAPAFVQKHLHPAAN